MIALRVSEAMAAAEVDQSELARRIGVTPGAINQIVTGRTQRSRLLPDIARQLAVSVDWLTGLTDDRRGDAAPEVLTSEEMRFLEIYRDLPRKDRAALKTLLERMSKEVNE